MGWSLGYDNNWKRDIGYGVPALCDHPRCSEPIDRGLGYVCGGDPYGGEYGCGLYFCGKHQVGMHQRCPRCTAYKPPYQNPKPDTVEWVGFKLHDDSWEKWREENPEEVKELSNTLVVTHPHQGKK